MPSRFVGSAPAFVTVTAVLFRQEQNQGPMKRSLSGSHLPDAQTRPARRRKGIVHASGSSFKLGPFEPYISSNPQFQTVVGHFLPPPAARSFTRIAIQTDDGLAQNFVDIANGTSLSPTGRTETKPIRPAVPRPMDAARLEPFPHAPPVAVVVPGLESSSGAPVTQRLVNALVAKNLKVFILNHRSCGGAEDVPSTFRLYHAAFTEDLETLLWVIYHAAAKDGFKPPQVFLAGFSLGSNIVCHFLSRYAWRARNELNIVGAGVACVPFDPIACQRELDSGWKGLVYSKHLVRNMRTKFTQIANAGAPLGKINPKKVLAADRLGKIDDDFISPVFGFRNKEHYYRCIDARFILKNVTVPTMIINARDDPFFDHSSGLSLPSEEDFEGAPVQLHVLPHGGHCGFLDRHTIDDPNEGYFQREVARFYEYICESARSPRTATPA